jgi:hypothetical protein
MFSACEPVPTLTDDLPDQHYLYYHAPGFRLPPGYGSGGCHSTAARLPISRAAAGSFSKTTACSTTSHGAGPSCARAFAVCSGVTM